MPRFAASILAAGLALAAGAACAQSGRGSLHGYVAFADVSYELAAAQHLHAHIALRDYHEPGKGPRETDTDDHGIWDLPGVRMGEYRLKITAPKYRPYETILYVPSDFDCRLAVMLKRR